MSLRHSPSAPLIIFEWMGDGFKPLPRFAKLCDKEFVIGENYKLEVVEERSLQSHNHLFAEIHEAWLNLPEGLAERFPTAEHLRKHALVGAGHCTQRYVVLENADEARRVGALIGSMDEYAIVKVEGSVVRVFTAKSISRRAVPDKKEFQDIKTRTLDALAKMIGVEPKELGKEAGRAA